MKEQKNIFYASIIIAALTLILSIAGEWHWINLPNTILAGHRDFCVSVCLNIFSGTIVGAILALRSYLLAKKDALIDYYLSLALYVQQVDTWAYNRFEKYTDVMKAIQNLMTDTSAMGEWAQEQAAYVEIVKKKRCISFFKKHSEASKIIQESLNNVHATHTAVSEVMSIKMLGGSKVPESYRMLPDKKIEIVVKFNQEHGPIEALKNNLKALEKIAGVTVKNINVPAANNEAEKEL